MGSIWLLVLIIVGTSGNDVTVKTEVHWANDPSFNNEQMCNDAGKTLASNMQSQLGTDNGLVFYKCQESSLDDMIKGAGKSAPTANDQAL